MIRQAFALRRFSNVRGNLVKYGKQSEALSASRSFCSGDNVAKKLSESEQEELATGRDLAKLSLMVQRATDAIPETASEGTLLPEVQVRLEQDVKEATELITKALKQSGHSLSIHELGDRVNNDSVSISRDAFDYNDLLRAEYLRDSLEDMMVSLDVVPPKEAWTDGSGKPFCRLERRELKRQARQDSENMANEKTEAEAAEQARANAVEYVPEHELLRRKAEMESASKIQSVLRGFDTALLEVSRVHKVGKGGTTMSMRALVVIGDRNGTAGYGEGKSETVAHAVERACRDAKRNLLHIDRKHDRTIHHRVRGKYVKSRVSLWPAPQGCGISANNNFNAVFQLFGIKDVGAKLHGPRSLTNAVKALFNALSLVHTPESIAATRGLQLFGPGANVLRVGSGIKRQVAQTSQ